MIGTIVIVGGGIAGVSTAAALRSAGFAGDLTLVDAGEFPYDRPPLSKDFLLGNKTRADLALQPPRWYDDNKVRLINHTRVTAIRPDLGGIELADSAFLGADRVVLATGGQAGRLPVSGLDSPRVHVLRTVDDAERLRDALTNLACAQRVLVVGAGLIGAEAASTAVDLGCEVVLADPVGPPLTAAVGVELAEWLHSRHTARGIRTVPAAIGAVHDTGDAVHAEIPGFASCAGFDAVVLGVGMVPDTALAEAAGLETDRGIVIDPGRTTSNPAVLAVGDATRIRRDGVLQPRTEHWEAARHDGSAAAATLLGHALPDEPVPWFWTDRHRLHVEVVGEMRAARHTVVRGDLGKPPFAVFGLTDDRVVAAAGVDHPTAVRAARRLISSGTTVDSAHLADTTTDLRALLRGRPAAR